MDYTEAVAPANEDNTAVVYDAQLIRKLAVKSILRSTK